MQPSQHPHAGQAGSRVRLCDNSRHEFTSSATLLQGFSVFDARTCPLCRRPPGSRSRELRQSLCIKIASAQAVSTSLVSASVYLSGMIEPDHAKKAGRIRGGVRIWLSRLAGQANAGACEKAVSADCDFGPNSESIPLENQRSSLILRPQSLLHAPRHCCCAVVHCGNIARMPVRVNHYLLSSASRRDGNTIGRCHSLHHSMPKLVMT